MGEALRGYIYVYKRLFDDVMQTIGHTLPTVYRSWNNCEQYVDFNTEFGRLLARVRVEGKDGVVTRVIVEMPIGAEYQYVQEAFTRHITGVPLEFKDSAGLPEHSIANYRPHLEQFAAALGSIGEPGAWLHFHKCRKCVQVTSEHGELLAEVTIEGKDGKDTATIVAYKLSELARETLSDLLQIPVRFLPPS